MNCLKYTTLKPSATSHSLPLVMFCPPMYDVLRNVLYSNDNGVISKQQPTRLFQTRYARFWILKNVKNEFKILNVYKL